VRLIIFDTYFFEEIYVYNDYQYENYKIRVELSQLAYTFIRFIITLQIFQLQSIVVSEKIYYKHLYKVKLNKILFV